MNNEVKTIWKSKPGKNQMFYYKSLHDCFIHYYYQLNPNIILHKIDLRCNRDYKSWNEAAVLQLQHSMPHRFTPHSSHRMPTHPPNQVILTPKHTTSRCMIPHHTMSLIYTMLHNVISITHHTPIYICATPYYLKSCNTTASYYIMRTTSSWYIVVHEPTAYIIPNHCASCHIASNNPPTIVALRYFHFHFYVTLHHSCCRHF